VGRTHRWFLTGLLAVALFGASPVSSPAEGPEVERSLDGSQPFSLGVDTSRFRVSTLGSRPLIGTEDPALSKAPYKLIDADLFGTAVAFDLKLRWPAASGASTLGSLAPYLSFGPTVLFPSSENAGRAAQPGSRTDGPMAIGLSWGAGGYRFMQFGRDSLSHGDRPTSPDSELTGHDVLYGISVRF
jgi:hypothetical protein